MSADPAGGHSYFDPDLMISIELPDEWQVASTDELPLVLLAPERDGFRANIGFSERPNDPPTKEHFIALIEQLKLEQERDFDAYELVGERRAEQDGRPAFLVRSRWDLEQGPTRVAQVAALYAVTEERVIEVHCTSLATLEGTYVPLFQRVLGSLRFLPTPR